MKRLITSFLFILVGLFFVDRIGGQIMWWVNQNTNDISGPKLKYLADNVNEDIILLGTSRCNFHYIPSIITDSVGLSVYNGGIDASDCIYSHYFVLNQILRHHTPQIICLELMTSDYIISNNPFETTSFFAPYIGRCERADSIFKLAKNYWTYNLCHLYRYNAKAVSNIGGLFINKNQENNNGYIPLKQPNIHPQKLEEVHTNNNIDSLKLEYVEKFITLCKNKKIKLFFTVSPEYTIADIDLYDTLKNIALKHEVPFFDYHSKKLFHEHPEYFKDKTHLWDKGAKLFTTIFAQDLKRYLTNQSKNN